MSSSSVSSPISDRSAQDRAKAAAGAAAAALVEPGMRLGLGTGSTTAFAIAEIGRRVADGLSIVGVPTSPAAERLARSHGIPLATLDDLDRLDLALDGADEVDPGLNLIKGRGAAHTREKVIASVSTRFVALVDPSKRVDRLGTKASVPIEVLPMACAPVMRGIESLGGRPELRMAQKKDGPVVSDQGFWVIDAAFPGGIPDPEALDRALLALPGLLDHGLFLGLATDALVGHPDGSVEHLTA